MGFLTTVTVYNDGLDQIKSNPKEFAEAVYNGAIGVYHRDGRATASAPVGNHANLLTIQKARHADNHTVYVHAGNTVVDAGSQEELKRIKGINPKFLDQIEAELKYALKTIKELKK